MSVCLLILLINISTLWKLFYKETVLHQLVLDHVLVYYCYISERKFKFFVNFSQFLNFNTLKFHNRKRQWLFYKEIEKNHCSFYNYMIVFYLTYSSMCWMNAGKFMKKSCYLAPKKSLCTMVRLSFVCVQYITVSRWAALAHKTGCTILKYVTRSLIDKGQSMRFLITLFMLNIKLPHKVNFHIDIFAWLFAHCVLVLFYVLVN